MLTCCFASKGSDRTPTSSTPSKPLTEPLAIGTSMASSRSITDSNHQHVSSTTLPSVMNKNKHACFKARSVNENRSRRLRRSLTSITGSSFSQTQFQDHREVMLNDIVGNGISGVLHKWVNYGRGWRPRWFVLQDAVLSYYKIHGPDKIVLSEEDGQGSMIIGERSMRRISSHRSGRSRQCKPLGEIHLMVCTIRESESDEKRFSIYTGTKKRLHLRAESGEDRTAWLEALRAVKGMFPRVSNAELMAPTEKVAVSTGKLRQRLLEEGVSEAVIQDSENIMRNELAELQKHVVVLKQKQLKLTDTLRHLVTEKVDLENTVVEENQRQLKDQESSIRLTQGKYSDESGSDTSDEHDRHDGPEDSDDDGNAFFDTRDYLSTSSFRSNTSDFPKSPRDSDGSDALDNEDVTDPQIKSVGSDYPYVRRRKKLPDPVEKEKGVSLWSMIKDNIGKDLTKVCLPVYFNEPLSFLQKCYEELEYSYLLDRAYEYGKMGNCLMRTILVAAFAVSAYACTDGRTCKPFNPLLGETYEADYPDKGVRFLSEKVSHHPMIIACHCEGRGWKFWADSNVKSKFWGRSIQLDPVGVLTLEFDDGDVFQWSKVTTSIYNLILGKIYCDHYGTMRINGNRDYSCKIKFKEASIIGRNPHQIQGVVEDKNGKAVASVLGKWDESIHFVIHDDSRNKKGSDSFSKSQLVWKRSKPSEYPTRYNLTRFAITLNEITPGLKEKLPPTDSRLRPDQRFLENGEYDMANSEKLRLEQKQRQARQIQEKGWKPRWFTKDAGSGTYRYSGGYWESREKQNWENCPVIFGQLSADSNAGTSP